MAGRRYPSIADKHVAIVHAIADLTQELGAPPTPRQVSERTGIPAATLSRMITALEASNDLGRVYGGRGLVLKTAVIDDLAVMQHAQPPLRRAITAAIGALHLVDGRRVPVTLVAMTARILESESALIAREVAAMVLEGALIQIDGGYLLPEINK